MSRRQLGTQISVQSCGAVYSCQEVPKHVLDCAIYTLTFQSYKLIPSRHHLYIRKKFLKGICSCLLQQAVWSNCDSVRPAACRVQLLTAVNITATQLHCTQLRVYSY
jgi:hypothetical protein